MIRRSVIGNGTNGVQQMQSNGDIQSRVYPEVLFGGFTRYDGTISFYQRVKALASKESSVLDIGCGRGAQAEDECEYRRDLRNLQGEGRRVLGIDVDPHAKANSFIDEFRLIEDVANWPIADASIDLALSDFVLEHLEEPPVFFCELHRVVKPGGFVCFRTPNRKSYVSIASRLTPNRFHARVASSVQGDRKHEDVFPTYYRCNTRRRITGLLKEHGFDACIHTINGEPSYLRFSNLAYRIGAWMHRLTPPMWAVNFLVYARKKT